MVKSQITRGKKQKKLYGNLAVFLFSIAAVLVLVITIYTSVLVNVFSHYLQKSIESRILGVSRAAAALISEEELGDLKRAEDMEKPLYRELKARLADFGKEYDVLFVYYYRPCPDGRVQPIIDNDFTENAYSLLTEPLESEKPVQAVFETGRAVTSGLGDYSIGFEGLISAFAPVFGADGGVIALAGVDISDEEVLQTRNKTIILSALLVVSILFVIGSGFLSFVIYGQKEKAFLRRLKQQNLMERLSNSLISAPDTSALIDNALKITGEFLNVTRIVIGIAQENSALSRAAYVWCEDDTIVTAPSQEGLNDIITKSFPPIQPEDGDIPLVAVDDVEKDPRYAPMASVGVKAFMMAPLYVDNKFWAVMVVEECFKSRLWSAGDRQLVSTVSSIIAGAAIRDLREKERNAALEDAKRASQAKSDFLSNMSHEMRTPMNAVIGMTAIAKSSKDPEKKEYCLNKIEDASTHLLGVINDILDMSKIEANKFDLSFDDFSFEKMLRKVVNVINFRVEEKRQILSVGIDKNIPGNLYGDDQRLAQVITNLLSNAVKFTPEEGSIRLDTALEGEEDGFCVLRISVTDSGIGISPEQQVRLFSSFQQADSSTSRKFGGTGLGLAISKRIIEMMNGRIWIVSALGQGSSFFFTVKLERGKNPGGNLLGPGMNWGNLRIMAVDDAKDIRDYFQDLSEQLKFSCDTAADGGEALEKIKATGAYDIYFVDWKMPGMNGIELTKKIKEDLPARSVVIMISAQEWTVIEDEAKKAGVNKFMSKPLFPSTIADCISECIGSANQAAAAGKTAEEEAVPLGDYSGFRLLLAEDVEINREILQTLLEPTNLEITSAENGAEALRLFTAEPDKYHLIFMDVQMPEMDGYEATRKIRAWEKEWSQAGEPRKPVPIVAMTANVFREDIEKCLEAGMNAHLGKPLDLEEVLAKLSQYLAR